MRTLLASIALVGVLAGCSVDQSPDSPPDVVARAAYRAPEPPSLTLMTMVNNRTGSGGHTALVVNGSQQVIFDPAGSFRDPRVIERGDVLYGMTPKWIQGYKSSHARSTYHVVSQELQVTDAQAEQILQLVMSNGTVAGAFCANATSGILSQVQGFESISKTFYPAKLSEQFASLPGVTTTKYYENDEGDVIDAVQASLLAQ